MKTLALAATSALALLTAPAFAQLPPGVDMAAVNTVLPEEGAPLAVPGPYAVTSAPAFGNAGLKVFHPSDLSRFPRQDTLPVVVWGNGGCAIDGARYAGFLETIASHGFVVVTTAAVPDAPRRSATAADLKAGIDWAEQETRRAGAALNGKIDTSKVAVMGQSCGGRMSIELGGDPRVDTIGVFNMGLNATQMDQLKPLHGPVLLINGHERDFMWQPSKATYDAIATLPAFYGARHGAGHTATAYHKGGGEFANVASNWVRWQFKGDKQASEMFVGDKCGLCTNPTWDAEGKRLAR